MKTKYGKWTFIFPIANVALSPAVGHQFRIDRLTLVTYDYLRLRRSHFGIPKPLSVLQEGSEALKKYFFTKSPTFGVVRATGVLGQLEPRVLSIVRDELAILALSHLGYSRRARIAVPSVMGERPTGSRSSFVINTTDASWTHSVRTLGAVQPLALTAHWVHFHRRFLFLKLLKVLRARGSRTKEWQLDLRNAAILLGLSQVATDPSQAFLWNMIALELLLTRQEDTYVDALPARAEAFLGWVGYWQVQDFERRIRAAYQKRCQLVHRGRRDVIDAQDVVFTDQLLLNLMFNVVRHIARFPSKESIVEFSSRVEAEKLLGLKSKTRPKTLMFLSQIHTDKEIDLDP